MTLSDVDEDEEVLEATVTEKGQTVSSLWWAEVKVMACVIGGEINVKSKISTARWATRAVKPARQVRNGSYRQCGGPLQNTFFEGTG
jgi:hypothetical protein